MAQIWTYNHNKIFKFGMFCFGLCSIFLFIHARVTNTIYIWNGLPNFEYGFLILGFFLILFCIDSLLVFVFNGDQMFMVDNGILTIPKTSYFFKDQRNRELVRLSEINKITESYTKDKKNQSLKIITNNKEIIICEDWFLSKEDYLSFKKCILGRAS